MRYNVHVDQPFCLRHGIKNLNEGGIFSILYSLSSWADPVLMQGEIFYHISRNKIIEELPIITDKSDTIYRALRNFDSLGLIKYIKDGKRDLVTLTDKGREWNSEKNPSFDQDSEKNPTGLGKKSENNSEKNPTDNNYKSTDPSTSDQGGIPPNKQEVEDYFFEKLNKGNVTVGAEFWAPWETNKFFTYYEGTKWKVGKAKMKDWRKAVAGWVQRGFERRTYLRACPDDPNYLKGNYGTTEKNGRNGMDAKIARAFAGSIGRAKFPAGGENT